MIIDIPLQQLQLQLTGRPILLGKMGWRGQYSQIPQGRSHGPRTPDDYRKDAAVDPMLWRHGDYPDGVPVLATKFL